MAETLRLRLADLAFMPIAACREIDGFTIIDAEGAHYGHISTGTNLDFAAAIIDAANAHDRAIELLESASTALWAAGQNSKAREIDAFLDAVRT